jgi:cellobiose transport system substrate-binding protein
MTTQQLEVPMSATMRRRHFAVASAAALALIVAGCGSDDGPTEPAAGSGDETEESGEAPAEQVTLTVDVFGEQGFGYEALYEQYMADNPHVTIEERGAGLGLSDYNDRLVQWITAGAGAGDVVALEEGTIVQFYAQTDKFVDLAEYGANDLSGNYLSWKWEQGAPGGFVLGLGTDVGSMGLCYRRDLFEDAGLPSDRDELAEQLQTWDDYIAMGEEFVAADTGAAWLDSATNIYNVLLMQIAGGSSGYTYYDTDNNLDLDNPDIRTAWDLVIRMLDADLSGALNTFSDEWNAGFQQAAFATLACPSWMTGVISGAAGDEAAGLWDVTTVPGDGGNWGGSFLAVPAESEHPEEAAKLAMFLSSPEGQIEGFKALGGLPSSPQALSDPAVLEATNEYFNDAPTGQVFGAGAEDLQPVYLGPLNNAIREDAYEDALQTVEQGLRDAAEAWDTARSDAERIAR